MSTQSTTRGGARKRPVSPPAVQQLHLRLPAELYQLLGEEARKQGVSLNNLAVSLLAGAIAWRANTRDKED